MEMLVMKIKIRRGLGQNPVTRIARDPDPKIGRDPDREIGEAVTEIGRDPDHVTEKGQDPETGVGQGLETGGVLGLVIEGGLDQGIESQAGIGGVQGPEIGKGLNQKIGMIKREDQEADLPKNHAKRSPIGTGILLLQDMSTLHLWNTRLCRHQARSPMSR